MKYMFRIFCLFSVIAIITVSTVRAQPQRPAQVRTVGHLTARVSVIYTAQDNRAIVDAIFTTTNRAQYNVRCFNAYRDIHYILRNSAGKIMAVDANAWKTHFDGMTQWDTIPCENAPWAQKESRAELSALFPTAPHGTYTLTMILAPRGGMTQAKFAPVIVQL